MKRISIIAIWAIVLLAPSLWAVAEKLTDTTLPL